MGPWGGGPNIYIYIDVYIVVKNQKSRSHSSWMQIEQFLRRLFFNPRPSGAPWRPFQRSPKRCIWGSGGGNFWGLEVEYFSNATLVNEMLIYLAAMYVEYFDFELFVKILKKWGKQWYSRFFSMTYLMLLVQYRHLQPQSRRGTTSVETGQGSIDTGRKIDTLLITSAMAEIKVTKDWYV